MSSTSAVSWPTAYRWIRNCSNPTVSALPRRSTSISTITPRRPGSVMCHNRRHRPAPSAAAAS
ncbi:hypothetical protein BBK82_39640 [Lentzea guizhouensis]|uniref:Uncharacterized protein n=1 Tax=Lentzea guizhouensis TaxID=1586287 RepID=A0A1B2HU20_9PSEU|nr:hypothetical protein [Lentzea guizhouensis]ANZ41185.1 hypothetical protein BBK82_39640 [Lentzea guizhouensis]